MEGIKAAAASQLWSGDWNASCISTDVRAFATDMDVNAVYTYGINGKDGLTYGESQVAYKYSPTRPAYLKETGYEEEVLLPGDRPPSENTNIGLCSVAPPREFFSATATSGTLQPLTGRRVSLQTHALGRLL